MTATVLIVFLVAATLFGFMALYNLLVRKRQLTNNGWSDIDVQLKRRSDLIPQLVNSVKGYASHERAIR